MSSKAATLGDEGDATQREAVARRDALNETKHLLQRASQTWSAHSCPASGECCQLAKTKRLPYLWPSEWEVLRAAVKRLPPARDDGGCPFLDSSGLRCAAYAARPLGCRTFFCSRRVGPAEPAAATNALHERLAALNLAWSSEAAPRSLLEWHEAESKLSAP